MAENEWHINPKVDGSTANQACMYQVLMFGAF
jgi:hypothetical protein